MSNIIAPSPETCTPATEALLDEWCAWMQAASMSHRTIKGRLELVRRLALIGNVDPATAGWQPVAKFLGSKRYSAGTRQTYHANIKQWFKWLIIMEHRVDDPMLKLHKPQQPRRRPRPITTAELDRLLTSGIRSRTRTMVLLAAYQGLRAHEIAKFRGDHIRGDTLRVLGKGSVDSLLPLHPLIAAEAERYPDDGFWFTSPDDRTGPILAKTVSNVLSKAMRRAEIHGTGHCLRHWYGTHSLTAAGGNLRITQELMRHANIASTAIYTQVADGDRRLAIEALPRTTPLRPVRVRRTA